MASLAWMDLVGMFGEFRPAELALKPPDVADAPARRWKVDAEREWKADAPPRRVKVDDTGAR
ncbi:MAG: hypothetical protein QGD93_02645 [Actinomycetota bacterium]|nr:hypothetical protein [Actinomycetota bacterium]